jgi:hypothetical protein
MGSVVCRADSCRRHAENQEINPGLFQAAA